MLRDEGKKSRPLGLAREGKRRVFDRSSLRMTLKRDIELLMESLKESGNAVLDASPESLFLDTQNMVCCQVFILDSILMASQVGITEYNGGSVVAMVGKDCVAIASDLRLGTESLGIASNFQRVRCQSLLKSIHHAFHPGVPCHRPALHWSSGSCY
jgi:hypothetical protein